jgi:hypothetical protein
MAMLKNLRWVAPIMILIGLGEPVAADVITDWNEKAVAFVTKHRMLPPQAERVVASVHVAMFDAVNSVERRYRPYRLAATTAKETSKETAAAVAAGMVLVGLHPKETEELNALIDAYLSAIPPGAAKSEGIKVGQEVAQRSLPSARETVRTPLTRIVRRPSRASTCRRRLPPPRCGRM